MCLALLILDILKDINSIKAIINITSDKCYLNNENRTFFKETDSFVAKIHIAIQKVALN